MAIEVEIVGNGRYAGAKSNITGYSVTEESTPTDPSDSSGATGQINFNAVDDPSRLGSYLLLNDTVRLVDGDKGSTTGKINSISGNNGIVSIAGDSRLGRLVMDVTAAPVNGTFGSAMRYYLSLAGIIDDVEISDALFSRSVVAQGWTGDLWTKIKELCVIYRAEITLIRNTVVVRPVRVNRALEINNVNESWSVSNSDLAKNINITYYNSQYRTNSLVYPAGGWNEDVQVFIVDASQEVKENIPLNVSLEGLQQPSVVASVGRDHASSSVYSVSGNDGLPIPVAQWTAGGGNIRVQIGEDAKSIDLYITGAGGTAARYAPYRIAMSSGPSDYYSSLRIVGTGLHYDPQTITVPTSADEPTTPRDTGVSIENVFVRTERDAYDVALKAAGRWASPKRTINITKANINKPNEDESRSNATFQNFDDYATANAYLTFGNFDAGWVGKTFEDFDDYWYEQDQDDFAYQVFGNANGARVQWRRAMYRIRTATVTEDGVSYTAEEDTTFGDFDEAAVIVNNTVSPIYSAWTNLRTNMFPQPVPTSSNTYWTTSRWFGGGGGTGTQETVPVYDAPNLIPRARRKTWTVAGNQTGDTGIALSNGGIVSITPGVSYTFSAYMRHTSELPKTLYARLQWRDASNNTIGPSVGGTRVAYTAADGWVRVSVTDTAPAGAATLNMIADVANVAGNWAPGEYLDVTGAMFEPFAPEAGSFFYGDTISPDELRGYRWEGTPDASYSHYATREIVGWNVPGSSYGPWELKRRNLFQDPRGVTGASNRWIGSPDTYTTVSDSILGPTAIRFSRDSQGAGRAGPRTFGLVQGQTYTFRWKFVANFTSSNWQFQFRNNIGSASGQTTLASTGSMGTLEAGQVYEFEYVATMVQNASGDAVLAMVNASYPSGGGSFDITDVIVEAGDTTGQTPAFFDGNTADQELVRYTWSGTPDASISEQETRIKTGGGSDDRPMTFADFDAEFSGLTFNDFSLVPLPYVEPEYDSK